MQSIPFYNRLYEVANAAILGLASCLALLVALTVVPGTIGFHALVVISESMEPALSIGDVVVTRPVDPLTLKVGDVVTYNSDLGLISHRIIGVEEAESGRIFRMKGDANSTADPEPIVATQVVARVAYSVPKIGLLTLFAETNLGKAFMGGTAMILVLMGISDWNRKKARVRRHHTEQMATLTLADAGPSGLDPTRPLRAEPFTYPHSGAEGEYFGNTSSV